MQKLRSTDFGQARRTRPSVRCDWVLALMLLAVGSAHASGPEQPKALSVEAAVAALHSRAPDEVAAGVAALGEHGGRTAVRALGEFLRQGQADALADRALAALGKTASADALPSLSEFAHHRRASARLAAYAASASIPGTRADELLATGLRDSDAAVRGLCARSLGERGAKAQLDLLYRALERGVPEAGAAIGRVGDASASARLHAQLGRLPIQVLLAGYEQLLRREDIDEASKLEIVARLGEVASPSVKQFLLQLLAQKELAQEARLKQALADTAKRIDDRPRAASGGKP